MKILKVVNNITLILYLSYLSKKKIINKSNLYIK